MVESLAANLIANRGNRCTATILSFFEEEIYPKSDLSTDQIRRIRRAIMASVNDFKDLAIDVVKSDVAIVNDLWVQQLTAMEQKLDLLAEMVGPNANP